MDSLEDLLGIKQLEGDSPTQYSYLINLDSLARKEIHLKYFSDNSLDIVLERLFSRRRRSRYFSDYEAVSLIFSAFSIPCSFQFLKNILIPFEARDANRSLRSYYHGRPERVSSLVHNAINSWENYESLVKSNLDTSFSSRRSKYYYDPIFEAYIRGGLNEANKGNLIVANFETDFKRVGFFKKWHQILLNFCGEKGLVLGFENVVNDRLYKMLKNGYAEFGWRSYD